MHKNFFTKLRQLKEKLSVNKNSYKKRVYKTWTIEEIKKLDKQIIKDNRKGFPTNLTPLILKMPYRSESSIRCKVLNRSLKLGIETGTYTEKPVKEA